MHSRIIVPTLSLLSLAACTTMQAQIQSSGTMGPQDATYIAASYQMVQLDNQAGALAAKQASDPRIKDFASQVVTQANALYPGLQAAMQADGIRPPTAPDSQVQADIDQLKPLHGAAFDKAYVQDELAMHKQAVQVFQQEADTTKDGALRGQAQTAMPAVEDNLAKLQVLAGATKPSQG